MAELAALLDRLSQAPNAAEHGLEREREIVIARAPGRLDLMGGIADYSGSLTLELPTREGTLALVQDGTDEWVRLTSVDLSGRCGSRQARFAAAELARDAADYASARAYFAA